MPSFYWNRTKTPYNIFLLFSQFRDYVFHQYYLKDWGEASRCQLDLRLWKLISTIFFVLTFFFWKAEKNGRRTVHHDWQGLDAELGGHVFVARKSWSSGKSTQRFWGKNNLSLIRFCGKNSLRDPSFLYLFGVRTV